MHESLKKNSFKTQKRCLAAGEAVFMVQIMKAWVQNSALCLTVQKWKTIQSFNTEKKKTSKKEHSTVKSKVGSKNRRTEAGRDLLLMQTVLN